MQYELSKEVEKAANKLIKEEFGDLASKNITFVFQEKKDDKTGQSVAQMRKGKPILADIKIVGGLNAFLASGENATDINGPVAFPVMIVSKHAWNLLKPEQRQAMLHGQLCRLDYDAETGRPTVVDYDVKAHTRNVKKYGAWNDDLSIFLKAAKQHPLFDDIEDAPASPAEPDAAQQARILKGGNGATDKQAPVEEVKKSGNGLGDFKAAVAKKRGRPASATK